MFGIQSTIIKVVAIVVAGVVLICVATVVGCAPMRASLASKEVNQSYDNSIEMPDGMTVYDPVEAIKVKADERVALVRAEQEKWRLLVWVIGIGGAVVTMFALFVRSPLDRYRKEAVNG